MDLSSTTLAKLAALTTYVAMTAWKRLHGQGNPKVDTASQSSLTSQAMTYERLRGAGNSIKDQKRLELRDRCKSDPLLCAAILKKLAGRKPQRKGLCVIATHLRPNKKKEWLLPGGDAQASNNEPGSSTIDLDDDFAENDKETLEADADDQFQTQIEQNEEVNTFPDELPDDVVAQLPHVDYAAAARGLCP
ncbi:hypothetical protein FPOAC1_012756 [Fusarium poae]|uniref:hypothetical protein n=1 Tax=Fusarium poae TaxID=36050 RepID=UPI001CE8339C|nr:hypothetical protein FPOAC1_012756 [Fusarium poae]KAG8667915.1 hypothetical protein FPOAC1_012756 [Fusarium poae]